MRGEERKSTSAIFTARSSSNGGLGTSSDLVALQCSLFRLWLFSAGNKERGGGGNPPSCVALAAQTPQQLSLESHSL